MHLPITLLPFAIANTQSFKNVITGAKSSEMEDVLGGIVADDMGLGKTLSMLAVVIGSLRRALDSAVAETRGSTTSWEEINPSKATLVIVPNSCESNALNRIVIT